MEAANIHLNLRRNRPDCKRFPGDLYARRFLPRGMTLSRVAPRDAPGLRCIRVFFSAGAFKWRPSRCRGEIVAAIDVVLAGGTSFGAAG
jgi:hypothetical protein